MAREELLRKNVLSAMTAGAHIGNSTAVYTDDDKLVCPYCDYMEPGK
jgi:hypothetical protein